MILQGKIAVVSGATSGIGKATALLFAREGGRIAALGRDQKALEVARGEIERAGGRCLPVTADVCHRAECQAAIEAVKARWNRLDILVNAAGIIGSGTIISTTESHWHEMMQVNVDGVFHMMRAAIPLLEKNGGSIVNVSSITGLRSFPNVLAYSVSKAAVDQLTRCAALELAERKIRVNAVNPGVVLTRLHRRGGMSEEHYAQFVEHSKTTHPLGRVGKPEEIAEGILYLATDRSAWVTGETLSIDGGRHLTCAR